MLMTSRYARLMAVAIAITAYSVPICAQQRDVAGANAVLPWAFVLNDLAPRNADVPDPDEVVTVPGSSVSMPRSAININDGPPDWHPDGHPPMPVAAAGGYQLGHGRVAVWVPVGRAVVDVDRRARHRHAGAGDGHHLVGIGHVRVPWRWVVEHKGPRQHRVGPIAFPLLRADRHTERRNGNGDRD